MRRVYGQRRFLTFLKFCLLTITYLLGFSIMMIGVLILAVFSV
jgi:hypothetical protein